MTRLLAFLLILAVSAAPAFGQEDCADGDDCNWVGAGDEGDVEGGDWVDDAVESTNEADTESGAPWDSEASATQEIEGSEWTDANANLADEPTETEVASEANVWDDDDFAQPDGTSQESAPEAWSSEDSPATDRSGEEAIVVSEQIRMVFADPRVAELAQAIANGDQTQIQRLAPGVDLSSQGDKNITLLQWALLNKRPESMQALLDAGADPAQPGLDGDTVVHLAAMANDPGFLSLLLQGGASPNVINPTTGSGPLRSALMGERIEQFQALLAAGADPNLADRKGDTPLHVAAQINEPAAALILLKSGADPTAVNAQGASFQRYLFMTRRALLNAETRRDRDAVVAWLSEQGIPLEEQR